MNSRILSVGAKVPIRLEINRALSLTQNAEKPLPKGYKTKPFVNQARQEWIQVKLTSKAGTGHVKTGVTKKTLQW
jgi:hypothetical protein